MTPEQLNNLREGDSLYCLHWDNHFSQGHTYKVYKSHSCLTIWCDDIQEHDVRSLNPTQFELEDGHDI